MVEPSQLQRTYGDLRVRSEVRVLKPVGYAVGPWTDDDTVQPGRLVQVVGD